MADNLSEEKGRPAGCAGSNGHGRAGLPLHEGTKKQAHERGDDPSSSEGDKRRRPGDRRTGPPSSCKRLRIDVAAPMPRGGKKAGGRAATASSVTPSPAAAAARSLHPCTPTTPDSGGGAKRAAALSAVGGPRPSRGAAASAADEVVAARRRREEEERRAAAAPPPEGVADIDSAPAAFHAVPSHEEALEASFLASYGREYYRHLFERDRRGGGPTTATTAAAAEEEVVPSTPTEFSAARQVTVESREGPEPDDAPSDDDAGGGEESAVPPFLSGQPHITPNMRGVLVDWLAEIADSFRLSAATLHLAVRLVDRTLRRTAEAVAREEPGAWSLKRGEFQCLGCACLLIASKMEETNPISVEDLVFMSDNTYQKSEIRDFELRVCDVLNFRLCGITAHHFAERFIRASDACAGLPVGIVGEVGSLCVSPKNPRLAHMVSYLLELSLLLPELSAETGKPGSASLTAAAAVYLARATLGVRDHQGEIWSETLKHYTGYHEANLENTVKALHRSQHEAGSSDLQCIFEKYSKKDKLKVAMKPSLCKEDVGFTA